MTGGLGRIYERSGPDDTDIHWMWFDNDGILNSYGGAYIWGDNIGISGGTGNSVEKDLIMSFVINDDVNVKGGTGKENNPYILSITK